MTRSPLLFVVVVVAATATLAAAQDVATVFVRVLDDAEAPLGGASVRCTLGDVYDREFSTTTDVDDGERVRFRKVPVSAGVDGEPLRCVVVRAGFVARSLVLDVDVDGADETLVMAPAFGDVEVAVRGAEDPENAPVRNADVRCRTNDLGDGDWSEIVETDRSGLALMPNLRHGTQLECKVTGPPRTYEGGAFSSLFTLVDDGSAVGAPVVPRVIVELNPLVKLVVKVKGADTNSVLKGMFVVVVAQDDEQNPLLFKQTNKRGKVNKRLPANLAVTVRAGDPHAVYADSEVSLTLPAMPGREALTIVLERFPTAQPTAEPTAQPTPEPTVSPTPDPTPEPEFPLRCDAGNSQLTSLDGLSANDAFGSALSMSADGERVAVGVRLHDGPSGSNTGGVRVFRRVFFDDHSAFGWQQMGDTISGAVRNDVAGLAVALSGDGEFVALASVEHNAGRGHVRVFRFDATSTVWQQVGEEIEGATQSSAIGSSLSLSHNGARLAIGASSNAEVSFRQGAAVVYELVNDAWTMLGAAPLGGVAQSDEYGAVVALSDDGVRLAVAAPGFDPSSGANAGATFVYDFSGSGATGAWTLVSRIDGARAGGFAGRSMAMSGNGLRVALGAPQSPEFAFGAGDVRVYEYDESTVLRFVQLGSTLTGSQTSAGLGQALSMSTDGRRLAATNDLNSVRVFELRNDEWSQVTTHVASTGDVTVALSGNGARLAYGMPDDAAVRSCAFAFAAEVKFSVFLMNENGSEGNIPIAGTSITCTLAGDTTTSFPTVRFNGQSSDPSDGVLSSLPLGVTLACVARAPSGTTLWAESLDNILVDVSNTPAIGAYRINYPRFAVPPTPEPVGALWSQLGRDIDGDAAQDQWGRGMALSGDGNFLAIGAHLSDTNTDDPTQRDFGRARVYHYTNTTSTDGTMKWVKWGNKIDGPRAQSGHGRALAISYDGDRIVIGAPGASDAGTGAGFASVHAYDAGNDRWNVAPGGDLPGTIDASDAFGEAVACDESCSIVAVGAPGGRYVRVFNYSDSSDEWRLLGAQIDTPNADVDVADRFGAAVALSADGTMIAIGSPWSAGDSGAVPFQGTVGVYRLATVVDDETSEESVQWQLVGGRLHGEQPGDRAGTGLALSANGHRVAVGMPFNRGTASQSGAVEVYQLLAGQSDWSAMGQDVWGTSEDGHAGASLSLSADGTRLAVGQDELNAGYGSVLTLDYDANSNRWVPSTINTLVGEADRDEFGYRVSLSADGDRVAASAPANDKVGSYAGQARVFVHLDLGEQEQA